MKRIEQAANSKLARIIYYLIIVQLIFVNIGTIFYFIPIIGESATSIFIPASIVNILLICLAITMSLMYLKIKQSKQNVILLIVTLIIFLCYAMATTKIILNTNRQGEKITTTETFKINNFSNVKIDLMKYTDQDDKQVKMLIYHVNDEKNNKPLVIYIHGGGWTKGTGKDHSGYMKKFAQNGYVVASLEYELSSKDKNLWNYTEEQLIHGIIYAKNNTQQFGTDESKLYIIGDSAGGNIALNLAYKINNGRLESIEETIPKIKAVSVTYPVVDIQAFYNGNSLLSGKTAKKMASSYIGGNANNYIERCEQHNPQNFITRNTPPTLIVLGEQDTLVYPQSSYKLIEKLEEQNIPNKLVKIPYANHGVDTNISNYMGQAYIKNTLKWFEKYA